MAPESEVGACQSMQRLTPGPSFIRLPTVLYGISIGFNPRAYMNDVTRMLNAIEGGDAKAPDELLPLVYDELRILAAQKLSNEKPGQTLQATALVHEAYIRLLGDQGQNWDNKGHFFKAAAEAMRRILVEQARRKSGPEAGGGLQRVEMSHVDPEIQKPELDMLALSEALDRLDAYGWPGNLDELAQTVAEAQAKALRREIETP